MNQNDRENQSDPELLIDIECTPEGFEVRVSRGGKVRYLDRGYKTPDDAWAAGRVFVKNWLRAQLQASGIARRGERPAFVPPQPDGPGTVLVGAAALKPEAIWVATGEQLCSCGRLAESICGQCRHAICGTDRCLGIHEHTVELAHFFLTVDHEQPPLEGELLCTCSHLEGLHMLGANTCTFEGCRCEEFTAALAVEAVQ